MVKRNRLSDDTRDWLVGNSKITVGRFTYGHSTIKIQQWGEGAALSIGQFCSIASGVNVMLGGNHRVDWITTFPFGHIHTDQLFNTDIIGHPATKGVVTIGNDVWLGTGATVFSGITIGDGAVIAAQAVVTRNVAPYSIVGGNPAKEITRRFADPIINLLLRLAWWDLPLNTIREIAPLLCAAPTEQVLLDLLAQVRAEPAK